jgi:hypothetical protein
MIRIGGMRRKEERERGRKAGMINRERMLRDANFSVRVTEDAAPRNRERTGRGGMKD